MSALYYLIAQWEADMLISIIWSRTILIPVLATKKDKVTVIWKTSKTIKLLLIVFGSIEATPPPPLQITRVEVFLCGCIQVSNYTENKKKLLNYLINRNFYSIKDVENYLSTNINRIKKTIKINNVNSTLIKC